MINVDPVRHDQLEVFVGQNFIDFLAPREADVNLEYVIGKIEEFSGQDIK